MPLPENTPHSQTFGRRQFPGQLLRRAGNLYQKVHEAANLSIPGTKLKINTIDVILFGAAAILYRNAIDDVSSLLYPTTSFEGAQNLLAGNDMRTVIEVKKYNQDLQVLYPEIQKAQPKELVQIETLPSVDIANYTGYLLHPYLLAKLYQSVDSFVAEHPHVMLSYNGIPLHISLLYRFREQGTTRATTIYVPEDFPLPSWQKANAATNTGVYGTSSIMSVIKVIPYPGFTTPLGGALAGTGVEAFQSRMAVSVDNANGADPIQRIMQENIANGFGLAAVLRMANIPYEGKNSYSEVIQHATSEGTPVIKMDARSYHHFPVGIPLQ